MTDVVLRALDPSEIGILTDLLHRAYAPLAARGLRYLASWQDEATTKDRIDGGECIVALDDGAIVGSITWHAPKPDRPGVATFQQFCTDPAHQNRGIASTLLAEAERRASARGSTHMSCDTSQYATELIAWYRKRGYEISGTVDYRPTVNYPSFVLTKAL
jgi:ribosomal protein S18 acetylase RimI-like enzyme